jgi:hypothetical protein
MAMLEVEVEQNRLVRLVRWVKPIAGRAYSRANLGYRLVHWVKRSCYL